jgi:hypothetical protein
VEPVTAELVAVVHLLARKGAYNSPLFPTLMNSQLARIWELAALEGGLQLPNPCDNLVALL